MTTNVMMRYSKLARALFLLAPAPAYGQGISAVEVQQAGDVLEAAPAPWLQEDPASQVYAAAREALNARRYEDAA